MWNRLTPRFVSSSQSAAARSKTNHSTRTRPARRGCGLALEYLEGREVPAVVVQIDYSRDANHFFDDPSRRAILQQAVTDVASHLNASLAALAPGGGNSWSGSFFDPATGQQVTVANPTVAANTIVVYAGGRDLNGQEAGQGGFGGYSASGSQGWLDSIRGRGPGFTLWGGSLAFDTNGTNWSFGTGAPAGGSQVDFYSVAAHEFGHLIGIGTAPAWFAQVSGGAFRGATAAAVYGGAVPTYGDRAHWADGVTVGGQQASMGPILQAGTRVSLSTLDYAALRDIGWSVSGVARVPDDGPVAPAATSTPAAPAAPGFISSPVNNPFGSLTANPSASGCSCSCSACRLVALTGGTDGSAQVFGAGNDGILTPAGPAVVPFPGFTGVIRSVVADFNADGAPDVAFATGAGTAARVRIIDGKTGADILPATAVLGGFTGGVFLSAGDVDRDGRAELVVATDAGSSPHVVLYKVAGGGLTALVDFVAFDTPEFRGGARVAMGDINRDGVADLVVGAGVGGGPRVSVYNGTGLAKGQLARLVPDFFALDSRLRSGVYVTAADFDGDGYHDIAYSTGDTGGPRVRVVSGALLVANPGADVATLPAMADFFALDANDRKGIRITAHDLNGDGRAELIVGSGDKTRATVRVIPLSQMNTPTTSLQNPFADPLTIDGVYVG